MSEVKLNLIDGRQILCGAIHGSIGDACVAALSAEPESIAELEAALKRYVSPGLNRTPNDPTPTAMVKDRPGPFASLHSVLEFDEEPWDAGTFITNVPVFVNVAKPLSMFP